MRITGPDGVIARNQPRSAIIGIALLLALVAYGAFEHKAAISTDALTATDPNGQVVRVETRRVRRRRHRRPVWGYVVRFTDGTGTVRETKSMAESEAPIHAEGDVVAVRYDPEEPDGKVVIAGDEGHLC